MTRTIWYCPHCDWRSPPEPPANACPECGSVLRFVAYDAETEREAAEAVIAENRARAA